VTQPIEYRFWDLIAMGFKDAEKKISQSKLNLRAAAKILKAEDPLILSDEIRAAVNVRMDSEKLTPNFVSLSTGIPKHALIAYIRGSNSLERIQILRLCFFLAIEFKVNVQLLKTPRRYS